MLLSLTLRCNLVALKRCNSATHFLKIQPGARRCSRCSGQTAQLLAPGGIGHDVDVPAGQGAGQRRGHPPWARTSRDTGAGLMSLCTSRASTGRATGPDRNGSVTTIAAITLLLMLFRGQLAGAPGIADQPQIDREVLCDRVGVKVGCERSARVARRPRPTPVFRSRYPTGNRRFAMLPGPCRGREH